jgi:glycosyltransferase involved in cell wall biosynthesis
MANRYLRTKSPLRVCYFGAYRNEYSRNRILIQGLQRNGAAVIECHESLWHDTEDRVQAVVNHWRHPRFWWRVLRTYVRLLKRFWGIRQDYDIMVVGYPGQFDVYLARILTWAHRKPLAWDIFMSIYLIAVERNLDKASPFVVKAIQYIERLACRLPDLLIIDTQEYASWFEKMHGIPSTRFLLVPTGADTSRFNLLPTIQIPSDRFPILYYGTFIPNHSVLTIVEAAKLLADDKSIVFMLVGDGPERDKAEQMVKSLKLTNVEFIGWLGIKELQVLVSQSEVCLGAFGTTPQSLMTVQNKIYEGLAMGKPVLTGDGPAVRASFRHGEHLHLCPRADPSALAESIRFLKNNPDYRRQLGSQGHKYFMEHFTIEHLGGVFVEALYEVAFPDS